MIHRNRFANRTLVSLGVGGALLGSVELCAAQAASPVVPTREVANDESGVVVPAATVKMKEAKQRFDRGLAFYRDGDPDLALIEFNRAYELVPNYRVLFNIGQVSIQLGQYANARRALEQYLREGGEVLAPERREEVQKDLEMLGRRTALLRVNSDVVGAEILVDDILMGRVPLSAPLLVDAGVHRVVLRLPGYDAQIRRITLAGGDESQVAPPFVKRVTAPPVIVVREQDDDGVHQDNLLMSGWVVTGVLTAGAVVTGIMGWGERQQLQELKTADASSNPELRTSLNDAQAKGNALFLAADVLTAAAIVTGGLSLWMTLGSEEGGGAEQRDKGPESGLQLGYNQRQIKLRGSF